MRQADIDTIAAFIRHADGNSVLGAGALAERLATLFEDALTKQRLDIANNLRTTAGDYGSPDTVREVAFVIEHGAI